MISLFITKNVQQYFYYLLKYNISYNFNYPFYIKTLKRVIKFFQVKSNLIQENKVNKLYNKIFTDNNKVTYTQAYDEGSQVGYTLTPVTAGTWTITINCGNQRLEKKFTIV